MPQKKLYLAAYDITCKARRARCASLLLDYGMRCQQSVYELPLARPELPALIEKGQQIIDAETDRLLLPVGAGAEIKGLGRGVHACQHDLFVISR